MANHDRHALGHELVRRRYRLLRIAEVVDQHRGKRLAENAAALVQVLHRQIRADPHLLTDPGLRSGQSL